MEKIENYALQVETKLSFEDTIGKVTEFLKQEGFGVLTEIDVKATLKKKIDVDWEPYVILGACNPPFAHKALSALPQIGVLLPCNIVVWDKGDHRVVMAMEPKILSDVVNKPEVQDIAIAVSQRIHSVLKKFEN